MPTTTNMCMSVWVFLFCQVGTLFKGAYNGLKLLNWKPELLTVLTPYLPTYVELPC